VDLDGVARAEGEAVADHVLQVAGAATDPGVDLMPLGEARLHGDHAEAELGHQEAQHAIAQRAELADVVAALADCDHPRRADDLSDARQVERQPTNCVGQRHRAVLLSKSG
jgi:hypothetical protein